MAKVKSYYTEVADEQVSDILKSYTDGKITADKAKSDISKVDNLNLLDIDDNNIDDVLFYAKEDADAEDDNYSKTMAKYYL
tara:strand:- start:1317 stop:1559 length:243 start_codon:yes stop_codon:yes gene_type:complete